MKSVKHKQLVSFDKTLIGYDIIGRGPEAIVLCHGLGGSLIAWSPFYEAFKDKYRFITWDYRGLYSSQKPKDTTKLTIDDHCRDLALILKKEKVTRAVFAGWSMGVQVCLEFFRKHARLYKGMILINGTSGYPYHAAFNSPLTRYIIPKTNQLLRKLGPKLQPKLKPIAKFVIDSDDFIKIVAKLGMIHHNLDSKIFRQVAKDVVNTDLSLYTQLLDRLAEHDASDVLAKINVPTLIIAGTKDVMTPSHIARGMAEQIKDSELFILNNASHYSLMEFPDLINERISQFLSNLK
ncbi:MAG: alpha/beta fold family hydrolase [uncultured bacterium]|nr:MAG: alpha/beta fold family hydrolase [uncultured bacterium]HLD45487.1 alpha/beta hydrolase [bacterium]